MNHHHVHVEAATLVFAYCTAADDLLDRSDTKNGRPKRQQQQALN